MFKLLLAVTFLLGCRAIAALEAQDRPSEQPLDEQLLNDLDSDLLDDLKLLPEKSANKPEADREEPLPNDGVEDKNVADEGEKSADPDQVGVGEDVGVGESSDPLTRIGQRMRTAKGLIDRRNTSTRTQQLQEEILDDLSALIVKLQSQQMRQSGSDQSSAGRFQAGEGSGASGEQANEGPEESTDRMGQADTALSAMRRQQELLRRMNWGSLPDRLRDQVRSSRVEQFLPKYARLIEQYYKRLAEESQYQP